MGRLNDIALVAQVTVFHNRRAFDQLVREYQSPVRRFLLSQTGGDAQLADDLAQETFIKAYTNIAQFRGTSSFLTWLTRIAYNVHFDYRRKLRTEQLHTYSGELQETASPVAEAPVGSSLSADIHRALSILRDEERTCVTLQLIEGYAINEIADITGMPQNTVKSHLKRGKERLANFLRQNGYDRP